MARGEGLEVLGTGPVDDDRDASLTGARRTVARSAVDTLTTATTFGRCWASKLPRGQWRALFDDGKRSPTLGTRLIAIARTIGACHDDRRKVRGHRTAPLMGVSGMPFGIGQKGNPDVRGDCRGITICAKPDHATSEQ